jgi:hypothetical protein
MKEIGTQNKNYFHWKVEEFEDVEQTKNIKSKMYRTVLHLQEDYPQFNRTKIYNLHNNHYKNKKDCCKEYQRFKISKIKEPVGCLIEDEDSEIDLS